MSNNIIAITPIIIIVLGAVIIFIGWKWRTSNFDYQCQICGAKFSLPFSVAVMSIHAMGGKYVKCPNCGQWCWANPVSKES